MPNRRLLPPSLLCVPVLAALLASGATVWAYEIQLAGMRLGQHSLHILKTYGEPDAVFLGSEGVGGTTYPAAVGGGGGGTVVGGGGPAMGGPGGAGGPGGGPGGGMGPGPGGPGGAGGAGLPGGMGRMGAPGAGGGLPMGGGMAGGGAPGGAGPGAGGMAGGMGGGPGGPGGPGMGGGPGAGGAPGMGGGLGGPGGGMAGMGGMGGAMGGAAAAGAAAARAGGGGVGGPFAAETLFRIPDTLQVGMQATETMWVYQRHGVTVAFILDRDGYIVGILVAGKNCDWARTALGEPRRTIKLGDDFDRVIQRYGYPQNTDLVGSPVGFSRDVVLHYGYNNNVQFYLRDMKVVRIFIWEADIRPTAPVRAPAANLGTRGAPDEAPAGMPPVPNAPTSFR